MTPNSPKSRTFLSFLAVTSFVLAACVTINVYFPEAAVKDLSEQIEDAVARKAAEQGEIPPEEAPEPDEEQEQDQESSSSGDGPFLARALDRTLGLLFALTAPSVHAQQVAEPEVTNPAIRRIIESRAQRVGELERYKDAGAVGESNEALVAIRDLSNLPLPDRAKAQKIVREENADRERMFKEIAAATGAELSQLAQIQETYARTLRERASKGHWIQQPNGEWTQK